MKGKSYFGYKFLFFIATVALIASAAARTYRTPFYFGPDPDPDPVDTPGNPDSLRFPIYDRMGDQTGSTNPPTIDLHDPSNVERSIEYDPEENRYYITEKIGNEFYRNPTYLTLDEYLEYQAKQDEQNYWKRRLDALSLFNTKPQLPTMYKDGIFDRIFGGNTIQVRPQGNVDVTLGGNWQNIKNPTLVQRAQKYGVFDFDLQMNINLLATIGDKMKLNISNNTKATFDYQNVQKLEYTGKEDEIIKKIEAGNISFPLRSSLITGVQSLFGLKTQLQFGRLWVTGVVSQQKSKRNSLTLQGGAQTQNFGIKADEYEENRHFLLGQYFRENYNTALKDFPVINSLVSINKIEVWITNRTGATDGVRDILAFMDLGEKNPSNPDWLDPSQTKPYPTNNVNLVYRTMQSEPLGRTAGRATIATIGKGFKENLDFQRVMMRKLQPSEYSFNPQLGYISLNTQPNPDDVIAVAYRYTLNGDVYQVGEFAEDLPPDTTNQKVMYLKLIKGVTINPSLPLWDLMMKNVYALGGFGLSKEDFRLNVLYQDPGGGEKRYLPEGPNVGVPLLTLLNLDRLNIQNDPAPDGIFDFVEGITINSQQGKIIFPVLEPFGRDLVGAVGSNPQLQRKYLYNILYDSTKTIARQFQQNNRYVIRGSYKSASSSEIFLGGFNIPQGSVTVSANGQLLIENQDYQIDYGLGRIKILNQGILNSGIPINIQYEDNATFGFQQQNFLGARMDYYLNEKLTLGGTFMRLTERPFTQKVTFGDDPIRNTVLGLDVNYQSESPGLTRLLDKLPIYSTTAPSFINVSGEVASLLPGHPKQINSLDGAAGSVYIDDFEGTRSSYDLKFPSISWTLASTPVDARDANGSILFPEASLRDSAAYNYNRARLAWYFIEPTLVDGGTSGVPDYVKNDPNQHYIRLVQQQDVFPDRSQNPLQNAMSTLDLSFYPRERGPYNFNAAAMDPATGRLNNPEQRWGGIQRPIDYSDFEASNVEFIEFWVMDPFITNTTNKGSLYINLGNVSEDVLKDSRKFFENGIQYPKNPAQLDRSRWGYIPRFQQQITRAFDNDANARTVQDVGYDGLDDGEEAQFFANFINATAGFSPNVVQQILSDPANDNYHYFRGNDYDQQNLGILGRYKKFNDPQGNSPITSSTSAFSSAATTIPESEDINRDNTLNESEDYFQYRIDLDPTQMNVGSNFIASKQTRNVKLPNGNFENETWYQFKVPIREFNQRVGNISDFRTIRFIRMFLQGFQDSVTLRFARLELGRNQWRRYMFSLQNPGENIPEADLRNTEFNVVSVSLEENSRREPVPYAIPPGVDRQLAAVANGQNVQLNEQALSLQVCGLKDGDARAAFKEVGIDMRQFSNLRMFMHAESQVGQTPLNDGDVRAIIRIGSDFTNNYYEYQVPLKITNPGTTNPEAIWPMENRIDLPLDDLVKVKTSRNNQNLPNFVPYEEKDSRGNTIIVVGNPNVGDAKTMLLGILNPKKTSLTPADDGLPKCAEVWFNELRATGINEKPGYAASGKANIQMADLGSVRLGGSMHTQGYGSIDQKVNQRHRDNFYQYDASTNVNAGKLMPRTWGVQLPVFVGYSESVSTPQYDPYDLDVKLNEKLNALDGARKDSARKAAQDFTSITSFNVSNVRILGNPEKQSTKVMPWSAKNFDLSYAYNRQFKRNPLIEGDELTTHRLGIGYTYAIRSKSIEPFKKMIRSRSKWLSPIKDFNFNPLPANFSFRSDINRIMDETKVRNINTDGYDIPATYYKNFTWIRSYSLRWELTRSLSFDYNATNNSRVDEPYGRIDSKAKRDTLWDRILDFGRNTFYTQSFNASYNVPLQKLPITDWMTLRLTYGSTYSWTVASRLAENLGNTIGNTQNKQINGELNFAQLYSRHRWLRAVNQPKPRKANDDKKNDKDGGKKDVRKDKADVGGLDLKKDEPGKDAAAGAAGTKDQPQAKPDPKKKKEEEFILNGIKVNTTGMSDKQLDSVRKLMKVQEKARKKAEKAKRKAARKAARKARRNSTPEVSDAERVAGRLLTMVKRVTLGYTEQSGTILPGFMDSTRLMGVNTSSGAPGLGFVYGYQPNRAWLESQAADGRLSTDSLFNGQFQQQYSENLNVSALIEPLPDFRIDLSLTKTFTKAHSELFKDIDGSGNEGFKHLNPYESGSFNISYIGLKTLFKPGGSSSGVFQEFLANREIISRRLGNSNPYTNGTPDPNDPNYMKGYTKYAQDVLMPSFIAAYTGRDANTIPLIDYSNETVRSNPFKYYRPLPNWRIAYNGLTKIPAVASILNNLVFNHNYTGQLSMNSFNTSLLYQDALAMGFPSFIDSNSGNYVPYFQVPNITITETFGPLLGFDASFRNSLTARFEFRKSRTVSLSQLDYQIAETRSTEYVIGAGYRVKGLVLPFEIFGIKKLKNDLNIKVDIGYRDDKSSNTYLAQNIDQTTRGQKVITISPSIDYIISDQMTLRLFYDRRQSIPYVTSSYPITTTRGGITLRFIFAQ